MRLRSLLQSNQLLVRLIIFSYALHLFSSCRTTTSGESNSSKPLDENASPNPESQISPPFALGESEDGMKWELRLNRMQCAHPDKPTTWCAESDRPAATALSGIEPTLISWIEDPAVTSVKITYMTFSSSKVAKALCDQATNRGLSVDVYLQRDYVEPPTAATGAYKTLVDCAAQVATFRVHGRGTDQWLNHAKIFLIERGDRLRFTSSSANLSSSGVSLHYDNWLLIDAPTTHPLSQQNLCYFGALDGMKNPQGIPDKGLFMNLWKTCSAGIRLEPGAKTRFIGVPAAQGMERPLETLLGLIDGAQHTIRIAAHKITATSSMPIASRLAAKIAQGISVQVVFDDDTILKALNLPGSQSLNVSAEEIAGYQILSDAGAELTFADTNEQLGLLMHNKYVIVDDTIMFTGAGNFSKASLTGKNTEQFYVSTEPALVSAYVKGWTELRSWAKDKIHFSGAQ